jgi:TonB family protein
MTVNPGRPPESSWEHLLEADRQPSRGLPVGILAAIAIHLAVFAVTWPTLAGPAPDEPVAKVVRPIQIVEFLEPPPVQPRFELPPRTIQVPDVDPFGPEPVTRHDPEAVFPEIDSEVIRHVPEPPPLLEEKQSPDMVEVGRNIDRPAILHRVDPNYPEAARKIRFEGSVVLALVIDREGHVAEVGVLKGLPFGLTESAVAAVSQWRFEPTAFNGRPVSVRYNLTIRFQLTN